MLACWDVYKEVNSTGPGWVIFNTASPMLLVTQRICGTKVCGLAGFVSRGPKSKSMASAWQMPLGCGLVLFPRLSSAEQALARACYRMFRGIPHRISRD